MPYRQASLKLPDADRGTRRACARTRRPDDADRRNYYKVEKWDSAELQIEALLHASNDLTRAREIFAAEKKHRSRGRYTLRQGIRVLDRWPPKLPSRARA